jgi:flagellar M-ring protein FliF
VNEDGEITKTPLDDAAIARITSLVKEAVGFDARRGDSINVINASFHVPAPPEPLPEVPLTEQQWVWDLGKQVLGGIVVLILVFGVLKPVMRSLAEKGESTPAYAGGGEMAIEQLAMQGGAPGGQLAAPTEDNLTIAKNMAAQDPARVAQVVKTWVDNEQ